MRYPSLKIDIQKLRQNTKVLIELCKKHKIEVSGVSKVFCGMPEIAKVMCDAGLSSIADSRIGNLKKIAHLPVTKLLLRLPMISEVDDVVNFSDISLNSEIKTIEKLSQSARKYSKIHKVILMVDVGDSREGILPEKVLDVAREIIELPNIILHGLGVNLNCYGGVIPSPENLGILVSLAKEVRSKCSIELPVISGGNTGSLHLLESNKMPEGINHLRLGESIVRGYETSFGAKIPNTYQDIFTFEAEVIEIQKKPSLPIGEIGFDSFGNKTTFIDKGNMLRAIIACGKQDIKIDGLSPKMEGVEIIGGSSDHTILDITNTKYSINIGDILEFDMDYGSILMASTSEYVYKQDS